ncbi:PAAR domain-containing protein [Salmonella enterica]|nr:PAAR domain-containing protein [Salmonella enterica]
MSKGNIRLGDKLTSGGEVINVTSTSIVEGKKIALIGDLVSCPIQGHGINRIVSSEPGWMSDGKAVAFDGALCQCGCRVIASTSTSIMG